MFLVLRVKHRFCSRYRQTPGHNRVTWHWGQSDTQCLALCSGVLVDSHVINSLWHMQKEQNMNFHFQTKVALFVHLDHFLMQFRENSFFWDIKQEIRLAHFTSVTLFKTFSRTKSGVWELLCIMHVKSNLSNSIETRHYCSFILCAREIFEQWQAGENLRERKERIIVHYNGRNIVEVTCSDWSNNSLCASPLVWYWFNHVNPLNASETDHFNTQDIKYFITHSSANKSQDLFLFLEKCTIYWMNKIYKHVEKLEPNFFIKNNALHTRFKRFFKLLCMSLIMCCQTVQRH